jgi:translation elongation factor EF-G
MDDLEIGIIVSVISSLAVSCIGFFMSMLIYRERMDRLRAEFDAFRSQSEARIDRVTTDVEAKLDSLGRNVTEVGRKVERLLGFIEGKQGRESQE